jgi:uncharacterized membrane protein YgcG
MKYLRLTAFLTLSLLTCCTKSNKKQVFMPTLENSIYDSAKLLSKPQADSILRLIQVLNADIGSQLAVITIDTLNGQEINDYSINQAERLQIGRTDYDDGILLTIAVKNRKMRIEVGRGLELIIKDEIASRINRQVIAPEFRKRKFGLGIYKGLDSIKYLIERDRELVGKRPK